MAPRYLSAAVFLLSAVGIAYQIILMRILTIAQWHHFAYMIISVAMFGFGASGTALALFRSRMRGTELRALQCFVVSLPLLLAGAYATSQRIPFETLQLAAMPAQFLYLLVLYALFALPFFVLSSAIVCAFMLQPANAGGVYAANLLGSGAGAMGAVVLLHGIHPATLPGILAAFAGVAHMLLAQNWKRALLYRSWLPAVFVALAAGGIHHPIRMSEYKALTYALQFPDVQIVAERYGPLAHVTAVASEQIRETPGQISNYPMDTLGPLPEQIGLFFDAASVSPVNRFDGNLDRMSYLDFVTGAVAFRVAPPNPSVLVIGSGGGSEIWSSLWHRARHVTAVEVDANVVALMRGPLSTFSGGLYNRNDVRVHIAEGRGFLAESTTEYDLIVAPLQGSFLSSAAGLHAASESYLNTIEAVQWMIDRLTPRGVVVVTSWTETPPRTPLKLFATAIEACERSGIPYPERHVVFIRSWNTATIAVCRSPLSDQQVAAVRAFCDSRWFDLCHVPGLSRDESNRYVLLEAPVYFDFAQAVLHGDREKAYRENLFYVRPATDDRPYFFRFVKWSTMARVIREFGVQGLPVAEWGYLVLVATLVQGALLAVVAIALPALVFTREPAARGRRRHVVLYFAALGCGYMFLEMAYIQRFMLFLAHPVYAVSVVLAAFLIFGGVGSALAQRFGPAPLLVTRSAAMIAAIAVLYVFALPPLFAAAMGLSLPVKAAMSVVLLAPMAACMGVPYPCGLQCVVTRFEGLLPWAWGINGSMSVVGALAAAVISIHAGFTVLVLLAAVIYIGAALLFPRLAKQRVSCAVRPSLRI